LKIRGDEENFVVNVMYDTDILYGKVNASRTFTVVKQ